MQKLLLLSLLLILGASQTGAQTFFPCDPNGPPGSPTCQTTCVHCDLDGITDKNTDPILLPLTLSLCDQGAPFTLENPRWYSFIAGSTDLLLEIRNTGCGGDGLEAAIVSDCAGGDQPNQTAVSCATGGNPLTLLTSGLVIGRRYFLLVDGIDGDVCSYVIEVAVGSTIAPELGPIDTIQGPKLVCPKATVTYTLPPVDFALNYIWTSPPGSKINGGSNFASLPAQSGGNTVTIEFGTIPIGGSICVTASNVCDTPKTTCIQITNQALPINNLPDLTLCFEELPFQWEESPNNFLSTPGTYTLTSTPYESYLGCDSIVRQKIVIKPRKVKFLPVTWLCKDECFEINGFPYCETGTYSEMLTADDGCDSLVNFTLIKIPAKAGVQEPDTITCRFPTVVLHADSTITKGNTVTYKWVDDLGNVLSTDTTATVDGAGPYYFIVTNYGGGIACSDTAVVTVPVDKTPPMANAGPNRVITCDDPVIQLQGSGSTGPQYTYLWLALNGGNIVSGAATLTPTVNATGTYRLRVTNQVNGCTQTDNMLVTADILPPTISATGGTFTCVEPFVTLQAVTGATGPTFAWTGPNNFSSTQQNPVASVAGEYTVVVTDSITGCTNSAIAVVEANIQLPGAVAAGGVLTCVEDSVTISGSSPATNPSFSWTGPNGFTSTEANPTVGNEGAYILTVTGNNGCTSTATANVLLDTIVPGATLAVSGNLNCKNTTVNITAGSNAPMTFLSHLWTLPDNTTQSTGTNPILPAAVAGNYSVVITNTENGCASTASITVVQSAPVSATTNVVANVSCAGLQNGSASASGSGGNGTFTYRWNNGDSTAVVTNLGPGTYTVTVTDGEQCTATATATITQPAMLVANATGMPQMANGAADGSATANPTGGTPGYTYLWSNSETTATISNLLPGSYTVTVTDTNGCTAVSIATVNAYDCTIEADAEATDALCFEANNGTATALPLNGLAPFTFAWSTGDTTATISNLAPGIYTVVVTDAANCPEAISVTISEPNLLRANTTVTHLTGPSTNDGSASANPTGGTAPYTYEWSTSETTATIENLPAGLYTVTVTDDNGCTAVQTVEVLAGNCGLLVNFIASPAVCNGQANGAATVVLNGGTGPFTYAWSSGGTAATEPNLAAGTYTVTITDANNCDVTEEVTITEPPLLTIALDTVINTSCPDAPEGSATVIAGGGTSPLSITWSNGASGPTATDLVAGTYTALVTDSRECKDSIMVTIAAVDMEPPVINGDSVIAPLGVAGNVTLSVQTLGLDVSDNCGIMEVLFQPGSYNCSQLGPHNVVVTAIDDAGNTTVDTIVVTVVDNLPPSLVCPPSVVRCFGNNTVQYAAPVATDNCLGNGGMFALVSGLPSGASFPLGTTTNTYTYTDADGNVGACTFEVTILTQLEINLVGVEPDKGGLSLGSVDIAVDGSLSPYTFEWFRNGDPWPDTTEDLDSVPSGAYTVIVTDEIGCTATAGPFVVDSLVNTKTPDWGNGLLIVPNPTSGRLSVLFPNPLQEDVQIIVYDMTGRLVHQQTESAPQRVDVDLSGVPDGLYSVLIRVDRQVLARKIVVGR